MLGGLAAAGVASLAGCLGGPTGDEPVPDPVALDGGKQCDVCGMVIADHPGPNGQIFYRDHAPEGHDNPAWFDSVKEQFAYHFEKQRFDWEALVVYATDYSAVDYRLFTERDTTYISCHVEPGSFADAADLVYVVGSEVHGAMGPDLIPFGDRADATAFSGDHGGEVLAYDDIDASTLARAS
ncbi:MAG: nitrous oxide reductase accessory protein NosL [Halobacteriales archaeon]